MGEFVDVSLRLLEGFSSSVIIFVFTLIFAIPLGLLIAFCSMSKFAPLRIVSRTIVWVLRGTPLMLQIFVIFYLPGLLKLFVWPAMNTGWAWFDKTISTRLIAALVAFGGFFIGRFGLGFRLGRLWGRGSHGLRLGGFRYDLGLGLEFGVGVDGTREGADALGNGLCQFGAVLGGG